MSDAFREGASGRDEVIVAALERAPEIQIPTDFASRIAGAAIAQALPTRSKWSGFGVRAALASTAVLLVGMFLYAPGGAQGFLDFRFDVELMLLAELGGVAYVAARAGLGE